MIRIFAVFFFLIFTCTAHSADRFTKYVDAKLSELTDFAFDSGLIKMQEDKDVAEYFAIKDCTLYEIMKNDLFKQQQMRQQIALGQQERNKNFNKFLFIRVPGLLRITGYNFNTQSFDIVPNAQMVNVGFISVFESQQAICSTARSTIVAEQLQVFPANYALKLNFPVSLRRVPFQSQTAKMLYPTFDTNPKEITEKVLYTNLYVTVEGGLPGISYANQMRRGTLLGQLDGIDIYSDAARTRRLKRLDYTSVY